MSTTVVAKDIFQSKEPSVDSPEDQASERDTQFDDFPSIPGGLVEALAKRMPERWPNVEMHDRDIWIRAGQHQLLDMIRFVEDLQTSKR